MESLDGVLLRGPDGGLFCIPTAQLEAFRLGEREAAEALELLGGEESVQGFGAQPLQSSFTPIIGMLVPAPVVDRFLGGDPDRPVVMGIRPPRPR